MTVVAATKYVSVEEMAALAEAGIEVVGENRAQDLERKHARYGDAFRWHFIGHLQSNKVKVVNRLCELVHSLSLRLGRASASTVPALLEVNLAGEETKSGVAPDGDRRLRRALPAHPRAHDDAAARRRPRGLAAVLPPAPRACAASIGLAELSMGTSQDYRVAVEEGATIVRVGAALFAADGLHGSRD